MRSTTSTFARARALAFPLIGAVMLAACSPAASDTRDVVRLGYFPNLTHATAVVGLEQGMFADALGPGVELRAQAFNAGPDVVQAIFSGALDISYIGPNPAINAFTQSEGQAIRIVAGATSGGAALVVRPEIASPADLAGATLAAPQLGNTQDVALRAWLAEQGYDTDLEGGGDVSIMPQANGQALEAFVAGQVDGAWVPEPWATRMVNEGGGRVLVDEAELWPEGEFVTTHLIVATSFLDEHPDLVKSILEAHVEATEFIDAQPEDAQRIVGEALTELTGSELPEGTLADAWANLSFTVDPIASSLEVSAAHQADLGLIEDPNLDGIYDLGLLNEVLREAGRAEVEAP